MAFKKCTYCGSMMHSNEDCTHPSKSETMAAMYGSQNKAMSETDPTDFIGLPRVALLLQCSVNPDDRLTAYVTTAEREGKTDFAIVLTNAAGQKISTLLSRDDAIKLQNYLNDFIINN